MGFLEELRRAKEVRDHPKTLPERPKSDIELLEEMGRRALWKSGVTEAFTLLEEQLKDKHQRLYVDGRVFFFQLPDLDKGTYSAHLRWYPGEEPFGSNSVVEKSLKVIVEKDGGFIVEGKSAISISKDTYEKDPEAVTNALGEAYKQPRVSSIARGTTDGTTPTERISEGGGGFGYS